MKILHILNGDDTLNSFKQTGIEGDVVVWREVLSEGPLTEDISSGAFWTKRKEWITQTFNDTEEAYTHKVIDEIAKLNDSYDEINLWFEFDMHCQINMLGVLMLLKHQVDLSQPRINLISPDDHPDITDFRGMGQLSGNQLEELYDDRLGISEIEFYAATNSWRLIVNNDNDKLLAWADTNKYWGNLHWLCDALRAHINRSAPNANGLNSVEQSLLDIYQSGITTKNQLYLEFWTRLPIYGMGDKELDLYLASLQTKHHIQIN